MSNEDLLAAANTAQAAEMARLAIAGYNRQNNVDWEKCPLLVAACATLHSRSAGTRLNDLTRSINIAPSANAYVARRQFIANVIMSRRR